VHRNRMIEITELEALKDIVVKRVTEQLGDPNLNACKLLYALSELTVHDASEPDIGWDNARYHSTRLAVELGNAKNDSDKDRRYINRIWKDMIEAYEVIEPSIENDARKAGFRKILKPRKTDPKTGRVEFYLDIEKLDEDRYPEDKQAYTKDGKHIIHYERVKNPKPSILGRFLTNIVMDKVGYFMYIAFPVTLFIVLAGWSLWVINDDSVPINTAFVLSFIYAFCAVYIFRAFYQVRDRMIIKAPSWMTKYFQGADTNEHAQLELVLSDKEGSNGEFLPAISLVVYSSTCPVCERSIVVDRGAGVYKGRLVGKCLYSPVEHLFSFDHVTRKGVPLRSDTYLG